MSFQSRDEFISAQASEKITLVHMHATARLIVWTPLTLDRYSKIVPYFVEGVKVDGVDFTRGVGSPTNQGFTYNQITGELQIKLDGGADPADNEVVVTYRFFFSTAPVDISWDLSIYEPVVPHIPIIQSTPGYKQKVGIDQKLTSIVGKGKLVLSNDGLFDDIFDKYYFENQEVSVYSWNRGLSPVDAKTIFRGKISDKSFSSNKITFNIKDNIFDLKQNIPQAVYNDNDSVSDSVKGNIKRWVYGRVDGLQIQSIDQIADGYELTGTVTIEQFTTTMTGTGTSFLNDLSPDDSVTIGNQEFTIESISSDTVAILSEEPEYRAIGSAISVLPSRPTTYKNRDFLITDHECSELNKELVGYKQLNRVTLNSIQGLLVGDLIEFNTGERIQIKGFSVNNGVTLVKNLTTVPTVGTFVTRRPVQKIFLGSKIINADDFTLTNSTQLTVTLDEDVEFNLAPVRSVTNSLTFTNGSRTISYTGISLEEILSSRDWIRPTTGDGSFYEVLSVTDSVITIRTAFDQATTTDSGQYKSPEYIGDDTVLSVDVLGRTEDGTAAGTWISTAAQVIKDALAEVNITDIDVASFAAGVVSSPQVVSLAIPLSPGSSSTTAKQVIDTMNQTVLSSITTNNELQVKFNPMTPNIPDNVPVIQEVQLIDWSLKSVAGRIYQNSVIRYRHQDVSRGTLEEGNSVVRAESDFVTNYIGTTESSEVDVRMYNQREAQTRANRELYVNRLSKTEVVLNGDLRLDVHEIGDIVQLDIDTLYKRLGDSATRLKVMKVVGKTSSGDQVTLICNDIANVYNTSSIITPNTAPDYSVATSDEKIKYGYITDAQGIIDDDEDTTNIHLIS